MNYKVFISGNKLHKEIVMDESCNGITIGTAKDSDVRLRAELFSTPFTVQIIKNGDTVKAVCSQGSYFTFDNIKKYLSCPLKHGDSVVLRDQHTTEDLIEIYFAIDFESASYLYDLEIDTRNKQRISIGGNRQYDIRLNNAYAREDYVLVSCLANGFSITELRSKYGVYLNGNPAKAGQTFGEGDFISFSGFSFCFFNGRILTCDQPSLSTDLKTTKIIDHDTEWAYPNYSLSSRLKYKIPMYEIEVKKAPPKPAKNRSSFLMSLLPSLASLLLVIVLRGILGNSHNVMFVLYSVCSMSIGIITTIASFFQKKRYYLEDIAEREKNYNEYIEEKTAAIKECRALELKLLNLKYASLRDSINSVFRFDRRIFEKRPTDDDFLDVWLGKGAVATSCPVVFQKEEFTDKTDNLESIPEQLSKKFAYLENAPVISHFGKSNCVGVVGSDIDLLINVLKNSVLDIAIRHFYKDVNLVFDINKNDLKKLSWIKWLQHVQNDALNIRNIMCDEESENVILEYLYSVLTERNAALKAQSDKVTPLPHFVVFVLNSKSALSKHPISKFFSNCNALGFTFVFLEEAPEFLPVGCNEIIEIKSEFDDGAILKTEDSAVKNEFRILKISDSEATAVAQKLSGIYVEEVSLESELTKSITLFDMMEIMSVDDIDLTQRWKNSQVFKNMAAPLGVKKKGEIVYLDIGDRAAAHGPHGLVAGTTGSGKSEIIQTYILSMATLFHPYDVGFVIIDFKGGGMANQFKELPHLIGTITNIDGREINRSLLSIKAELVKRQELFSENGVNHINDYIRLYKQGKISQPLPHLIMVVDEFAELKAEYPDFMKEIISAARIGRTLGVHLILATQKPSGVVDEQIWSNSKFKLCLKVQTREDSSEVIKSPLAAEIVEPGRAYFQVGNNEIFELFQSAYSGAKVIDAANSDAKSIEIFSLNDWGKRSLIYTNRSKGSDDDAPSQLEAIVSYINSYCRTKQIKQLPGICLPPLPDVVMEKDIALLPKTKEEGLCVSVGLVDDPNQQYQGALQLDLSTINTYVIGASQTGKTTFLQTIIYQAITQYSPEEVNIYIADCGNMALKAFENVNHVGGVVTTAEEDKMANLFKLINNQIKTRKEKLQEKGLGTYKAYVEAGFTDLPQIVLIIDNIAVFREYYPNFDEYTMAFSRDGLSVGISMIVTSLQTNSIGFRVLSNFGSRFAFNCNDSGEYGNLFDRCKIVPKDTPGRGLCTVEKRVLEFQASLCIEGKKEIDRVNNIRSLTERINAKFGSRRALPIPEVPQVLRATEIAAVHPVLYGSGYKIPIGINFDTVDFEYLELLKAGAFGISGREKSGKTNFISHILTAINRNIFKSMTEAYVIDSSAGSLEFSNRFGFVKHYSYSAASLSEYVDEILAKLEERKEMVSASVGKTQTEALENEPLLLLVIENSEVFDLLAEDKQLNLKFNRIFKGYKKLKSMIIFTDIENIAYGYNAPEAIKYLRENKKMMVFDDVQNIKILDVSSKQVKAFTRPIVPGDGYYFMDGEMKKVKTILNDLR